jgi:hypothetical protein
VFLGEQLQFNTSIGGVLGMLAVYFINKKQEDLIDNKYAAK